MFGVIGELSRFGYKDILEPEKLCSALSASLAVSVTRIYWSLKRIIKCFRDL